ncbi:ComEC/Rec2-related protein [Arcanobacterium wilhelmae]|uniref:ComEC/Rec2-related protein n=1 Tax=Arcanobacterium wilhelmae TaxID=1803177 RepID=A0ABT9ND95_9ACTO|nr:ComEC/Rec2 family competence protein [Arcanobacterium wilhelmae]MDP9801695.1 ComEC/Rec2-related protein [Arcanobacterium wilhelmae]WFN91015.1 ComEC/Rec2 family competence protein [Arcanobacterium wilhelmae]
MGDLRLGPAAVVLWLGAICSWHSLTLTLAGLILVLGAALWQGEESIRHLVCVCAVALVCTNVSGAIHDSLSHRDPAVTAAAQDAYVRAVVEVASHPTTDTHGGAKFRGVVSAVEFRGTGSTSASHVEIRLTRPEIVTLGETLLIRGRVGVSPRGGDLQLRGVIESRAPLSSSSRVARTIRERLTQALRGDDRSVAGLLPGILVGDDSELDRDLKTEMRSLSLSHLTAVSGAHVSLVVGGIIAMIGLRRGWLGAVSALAGIWALVRLVGPDSSVLRAVWMGVGMCTGYALRRRVSAFPLLALTVGGTSLVDPHLATSVGFVLSVLATAGIITVGRPLTRALSSLPKPLGELISIPVVASLATAPVVANFQDEVSVWGVVANVVVAPVVAPLTITGLAASVLLMVPGGSLVAWVFLGVAKACTWWIVAVTHVCSSFPFSQVPFGIAALVNAGVVAALVAALALMKYRNTRVIADETNCTPKTVIGAWNNSGHAVERNSGSAGSPHQVGGTGLRRSGVGVAEGSAPPP